ncbi:MAG: ABC-F family ATP-binding cassette domain-containing protein [Clostridiales bacterium]|nr:ABC-F family ATP-binding cassette domain-containing protein [Clostridiales bacterium]MBS5877505.1 ABC-F family ATP-binding cassette domain-containing protein [Clostridiales bacterium]MDU0938891.1 ABC-F family ATP-binding cassette domain-containing protein [Clostridiales bacterium]MDU1041469.1 ABC-F family ATP-binding cassette domain-containing protein [Clostridiales bacterium]MDU3490464.1 ABC-F family ATP-binding cassette domain-containing protein [Clostridiales bacterium]
MILNVSNLNKTYIEKPILKDVSFHIEDREKAAIVGINGSGKTTLIRCILGEEEADSGIIALSKGKKMGYLAQQHDEMDEGYDILSGGQKTRKRLEEVLLDKPDLLILDEPTNHLDIDSIKWLEKVLKYYDGAVLLVSHDRYFLDRVVNKVIDLENGKARMYRGNYSDYAEKKKMLRDAALKAYMNQQEDIKHQETVIQKLKQFNREKSIKRAESREKSLHKMDRLEKPDDINNEMKLSLEPNIISGNDVLSVADMTKYYMGTPLFENVSFDIKRGEHVAVIGPNGSGKTTLLKILNGMEEADSGSFKLGSNVHIGYYDQEHAVLDMDKSIFDEIHDAYPDLNNTKVRNVLAAFLFTGDDVYKKIGDLSGGERGRVSLAKLMLSEANLLVLDEPTNHLDIQGKEVLEDAVSRYEGTVIYVSHDRYFINKTASRILELYDHRFDSYIGNYDYYVEKREDVRRYNGSRGFDIISAEVTYVKETSESKLNWAGQKEFQARLRKAQNGVKRAEQEIAELEAQLEELDKEMARPEIAANVGELMDIHKTAEAVRKKLETVYEDWERYSQELEELEE